ncbi:alpha/beta fold hydrolase [Kribbella sp. DT2]|uniref:alpha/beta fold hydrolase n=1 Tax=Kribbella sp. DT2 TaxID=3393427 RepID=UPI003CF8B57C
MTYVLIPGGGCTSYHWHPLTDELRRRGHRVIPVDLPCDDPSAGLGEYADAVATAIRAAGNGQPVTLVAHSLGGLTAPLVCARVDVELLVFVAGMVPLPGESGVDWWVNTNCPMSEDESVDTFFDDLPAELAEAARREFREQSGARLGEPSPLRAWPDVPVRAVIARGDLLFPPEFLRRVTEERLGISPDEVSGGHFPMLGHPGELADLLESYRNQPTVA